MPLLILLLVFIAVPIAEIYVIIQVGEAIGALPTIAILIADSVIGSWLLRSQGRAAWRRFNQAIAERRPPAREVVDGVLIVFGGALLIPPGFISDVFGLLLLLPPTRAIIRVLLVRNFTSRLVVTMAGGWRDPGARHDYDVDGTAHDVPPRPLGR
jgi:UPF0716 protein FxsA